DQRDPGRAPAGTRRPRRACGNPDLALLSRWLGDAWDTQSRGLLLRALARAGWPLSRLGHRHRAAVLGPLPGGGLHHDAAVAARPGSRDRSGGTMVPAADTRLRIGRNDA